MCAMKRKQRNKANRLSQLQRSTPLLPALLAFGSVISSSAYAIELGDANIESTLGQPLRASIAYALNPNEQLMNFCIFLQKGNAGGGVPYMDDARISLAGKGKLLITGKTPVKEPMIGFRVAVDCPNTAKLSRDYTLFVDPADYSAKELAPAAATLTKPVKSQGQITAQRPAPKTSSRPARVQPADTSAIDQGTRYMVQPGESLSTIAARVSGRPTGLWRTVQRIFEANPDAFLNNNIDRLKASVYLDIPVLSTSTDALSPKTNSVPVVDSMAESTTPLESVLNPALDSQFGVTESAVESTLPANDIALGAVADQQPLDTIQTSADKPQLIDAVGFDPNSEASFNPFVTAVPGPGPAESTSRQTTAFNDVGGELAPAAGSRGESTSWWPFIAGGLLGLFLALMLFGRRLWQHFRPGSSNDSNDITFIGEAPDIAGLRVTGRRSTDYQAALSDSGNDVSLADSGSNHAEIEITEDFSFSDSFDQPLDLEFPAEDARAEESDETDIIPPMIHASHSILDEEVLPSDEPELDVSVALNTTLRSAHHKDSDMAKDFEAVDESSLDDTTMTGSYSAILDFDLLEKDYEHELSETQAANMADAKAAFDMMKKSTIRDPDETAAVRALDDVTVEMPRDDEVTAEMAPQNEATAEMPRSDEPTVEMPAEDPSLENSMIAEIDTTMIQQLAQNIDADNDETQQMDSDADEKIAKKKISNG